MTHAWFTHVWSGEHALPHAPQFVSVRMSTHWFERGHLVKPWGHRGQSAPLHGGGRHVPATQLLYGAVHFFPQAPQLEAVLMDRHEPVGVHLSVPVLQAANLMYSMFRGGG